MVAVSVVGADLADFARVVLGYDIGGDAVDLNVWTQGTSALSQPEIHELVRKHIALDIYSAARHLDLRNPKHYLQAVEDSDLFQNPKLPWNVPVQLRKGYEPVALGADKIGGFEQ